MYHVPMCVMCGENEVGTFQAHDQFCGDMCADRYQEALEVDQLCTMCRTHEAVEDGFCSFQCENLFYDNFKAEEVQQEDAVSHTWEYEDHMAQWDNDPSPYDGTYSEM